MATANMPYWLMRDRAADRRYLLKQREPYQPIVTTPSNRSACEICGRLPPDRFVRNQVARDIGARYVRTRSNRARIDAHLCQLYADRLTAAGMADWAGRLACDHCYLRFIHVINR